MKNILVIEHKVTSLVSAEYNLPQYFCPTEDIFTSRYVGWYCDIPDLTI